jgi:peptidoglycan/xylan/chitin deacetylase (PgdA/CDA1 family)
MTERRPELRLRNSVVAAGIVVALVAAGGASVATDQPHAQAGGVAILVYHRFEAEVHDSMAVTTSQFARHLQYLADHQYRVIPFRNVVTSLQRHEPLSNGVVITVDDGHRSVYTDMLPLVRKYRVPVTLFIYPSAISNASYAMTWNQLQALKETGFFDIQSHTYWHPNFKNERRRLDGPGFDKFVTTQLVKPRDVLRAKLGVDADMLAWPFGIYDDDLMGRASAAGYIAGLTLDARLVKANDRLLALPRFLVTAAVSDKRFQSMLP